MCFVEWRRFTGLGDEREPAGASAVATGAVRAAARAVPGPRRLPHPLIRVGTRRRHRPTAASPWGHRPGSAWIPAGVHSRLEGR